MKRTKFACWRCKDYRDIQPWRGCISCGGTGKIVREVDDEFDRSRRFSAISVKAHADREEREHKNRATRAAPRTAKEQRQDALAPRPFNPELFRG